MKIIREITFLLPDESRWAQRYSFFYMRNVDTCVKLGAGRAGGAPSRTRAWKNKKSGVQRQKEAAARRRQAAATAPDGRGGAGP